MTTKKLPTDSLNTDCFMCKKPVDVTNANLGRQPISLPYIPAMGGDGRGHTYHTDCVVGAVNEKVSLLAEHHGNGQARSSHAPSILRRK